MVARESIRVYPADEPRAVRADHVLRIFGHAAGLAKIDRQHISLTLVPDHLSSTHELLMHSAPILRPPTPRRSPAPEPR